MKVSDFNYELPEELIAQDPLEKRSDSRLMVLNRKKNTIEHKHFRDIVEYLSPGDCPKVIPARLLGVKPDTGAAVEVLLLRNHGDRVWEALVRPGKKLKPGAEVSFGDGLLTGVVEQVIEGGNHSQFGSYGMQDGDTPAQITPEQQVEASTAAIAEMFLQTQQ